MNSQSSWLILSCYLRFVFFQTFFPISQYLKAELWFIIAYYNFAFVIPRWVTFLPHNGCTSISHLLSCHQGSPGTRNTKKVSKVYAQYTPLYLHFFKKAISYLFQNINCCTKRLSCGIKSVGENTDIWRPCIKTKCSFYTEVAGETWTKTCLKHVNFLITHLAVYYFPPSLTQGARRNKGCSVKEVEKKPNPHHRNKCVSSCIIWWKSKAIKKHEQARLFCCWI